MTKPNALGASQIALQLASRLEPREGGSIVVVTSARAQEGKSFVAGLLARELSQSLRMDVVLADASDPTGDTIRPDALPQAPLASFAELVADGDLQVHVAPHDGVPHLLFLPGGPGLRSARFNVTGVARAFGVLRQRMPLTVVDAPSLGECGALLVEADAIVLVVDSRRTPPDAIQRALSSVQLVPGRLAVVLNHAPPEKA